MILPPERIFVAQWQSSHTISVTAIVLSFES